MRSCRLLSKLERMPPASPMDPASYINLYGCYITTPDTMSHLFITISSVLTKYKQLLIYYILFLCIINVKFFYYCCIFITEEQNIAQRCWVFPVHLRISLSFSLLLLVLRLSHWENLSLLSTSDSFRLGYCLLHSLKMALSPSSDSLFYSTVTYRSVWFQILKGTDSMVIYFSDQQIVPN